MKSQTFKLVMTIICAVLVFALLTFGVVTSVMSYKYNWNSRVDLVYVPQDVALRFEGKINNSTFIANAENATFDKNAWAIPNEETAFSKTKVTISINLKFINKCSSDLKITISGIHFDSQNRFSTYLTDENDMRIESTDIVMQADGTGIYIMQVAGGLDEYNEVNLNYTLKETTVNILGTEDDKQNLVIRIDQV